MIREGPGCKIPIRYLAIPTDKGSGHRLRRNWQQWFDRLPLSYFRHLKQYAQRYQPGIARTLEPGHASVAQTLFVLKLEFQRQQRQWPNIPI